MQVLCDTSFLMVLVAKPLKQVDRVESYFGKLDFLVPETVIEELARIERKAGPKRSLFAKTALDLAKSKFRIVSAGRTAHVDDSIIDYAIRNKCAVATIDGNLRRRLLSNRVFVITLSRDRMLLANPPANDQI